MIIYIDGEEFLSAEDVEKLVNQKSGTIDVKVRFGAFPSPVKLKVKKFWRKSDIEAYLREKQKEK